MTSALHYQIMRFFFVLVIIFTLLFASFYLSSIAYPFLIGLGIAYIINRTVNFFQYTCKIPRSFSVFISLTLLIGVILGGAVILITELVSGAAHLSKVVPAHVQVFITHIEHWIANQFMPVLNKLTSLFNHLGTEQQASVMTNIEEIGKNIGQSLGLFLQSFFEKLPALFSWIPNAATVIIFSLLASFFISKDWERIKLFFLNLAPEYVRRSSITVFTDLKSALFGFIKAQATLISITTLIILLGLLILNIDYAMTIAIIAGMVDILPYLGTGIIFIPWIIYSFFIGETTIAVGLSILYVIIIVQRQVMEPKILSSNIGLDPLATLIALFIGFKLFGFLGLIIGPIILVILSTLYRAKVFTDIWFYIKNGREKK